MIGNATHVHACSSQAVRFNHSGLGAVFSRALGAGQAAAAAADADEIEGKVGHGPLHPHKDSVVNDTCSWAAPRLKLDVSARLVESEP
jgi:hypothetical protein